MIIKNVLPWLGVATALLLAGCGSGTSFSAISDAELEKKAQRCTRTGGSNKIMAMTCGEVRKECAYRNEQGKRLCAALR